MGERVFEFEGRTLVYDPHRITMADAQAVHALTGWGMAEWADEVDKVNPVAVGLLHWLVCRQNGDQVDTPGASQVAPLAFVDAFIGGGEAR